MRELPVKTATLQGHVSKIMRLIRKPHFQRPPDPTWNPRTPVIYFEETCFGGDPFQVPMVILRTQPCRWFTAGGCVMCNYELIEANDQEVTGDDLLAQVDYAIEKLGPLSRYQYLFITSGGSFLDSHEVPDYVRIEILKRLRQAGLKRISFESEAKYCLDNERLAPISEFFPGSASVGIGLESADSLIRNVVVNKGLSQAVFERATNTLRRAGIDFYVYVLLGKPFLTIAEDEADCVETIIAGRQAGAFMTVVEMINIQPFTLTGWLWERNRYTPPPLWSGLRVIRDTPEEYRRGVSIKGLEPDDGVPPPLESSQSCPLCSDSLRNAIRAWNLHRELTSIEETWGACSCFTTYETSRSRVIEVAIEERVSNELHRVADELGITEDTLPSRALNPN